MQKSNQFWKHFLNDLPVGVIEVDGEGNILLTNHYAKQLFNLSYGQMGKGGNIFEMIENIPEWEAQLRETLQKKNQELGLITSNGKERFLKIKGNWNEHCFVMFVEDITKIKTIEKSALHATLEGQEQERRRIAQEIHDGLGPLFSSLTLHIESLEEIIEEKTPEFIFECSILRELSKTIAQDIRAISHDLMPSAVEDFGLVTALENLCETTNEVAKSEISFYTVNMEERLDKNIELGLYRIGQELLNNALKYANAESIIIQLIRHEDSVVMMVEDDGEGFDKESIKDKKKGIGWRNINTRTKSLGGYFTIDAQVGEGVLATVEIPLNS